MKISNKLGIRFIIILAAILSSGQIIAQGVISHKSGAYYNDFLPNGMQKTHEYSTTVYVNPNSSTVTLSLPSLSATSPHHYFRWYDYETDGLSPNLRPSGTTYTNGYAAYGGNTRLETTVYNINASQLPDIVACDISSYTDYTIVNNYLTVEPTLSYRSIFEIRDGNEMATQLRDLTATGNYLQDVRVYMPANPASTHQLPRVTLKYESTDYFGYDGQGNLLNGNIQVSGPRHAGTDLPFIYVNPGAAGTTSEITVTLTVGNGNNQRQYNIARFTIEFISESPQEFTTTGYRSIDYLDANYVRLASLDFDYDTNPATAQNNMWSSPLPYSICEYGFVSEVLYNNGYRGFSNKVAQWNEYGFYKTANVPLNGLSGYTWYNGGYRLYDRRYFITDGREQGYFMYIDAAQSPGVIARLPIEQLCAGTKLFVSAGIASMTRNTEVSYPDLNFVFMGIDSEGNQIELNRYTSGDIPSNTSTTITPWYQIYYAFTYDSNEDFVSYLLQIENNCTGTRGGDYAVDDFRIYRSKPAIQPYQVELLCGDEDPKVKVRVDYDKLLSALGVNEVTNGEGELVTLKYKLLNSNQEPVNYNYGTTENPNYEYGQISVSSNFSEMEPLASDQDPPIANGDLSVITDTETEILDNIEYRYVSFLVPNTEAFQANTTYYAVVADGNDEFDTGTCALISDPFTIIPSSTLTLDGVPWIEDDGLCYGNTLEIGALLRNRVNANENIEALFDWYFDSLTSFQTVNPETGYSVQQALNIYRSVYPDPNEGDGLSTIYQGNYTEEIHDILQAEIDAGRLILNQKSVTRVIREADNILAIPLIETAELPTGVEINDICSDIISIQTNGPAQNPTIQLGNPYFQNLRMGLEQFYGLQGDASRTLTVPVSDFMDSDGTKNRPLTFAEDRTVYVIDTNDPNTSIVAGDPDTFIAIAELTAVNVSNTPDDNIVFYIPAGTDFSPREGYSYTMEFHFNETTSISEAGVCDGTGQITIIIVPEYLTWTGENGDNWNNDDNWRRSTANELYKSDYTDDPDSHGYVPMDFSKVTIPGISETKGNIVPWLYNLTGSPYLNMDNTNYTTAAEKAQNAATDSIQYDLCVEMNGTNYSTVNFYGNTADQIYFKPTAEMRSTNYLIYNKAYIDFELASERWYMLASPLKDVVAGDMYLPTATARQETEAFVPITYDPAINNRFDPAVYQRSWDQTNSIVFRQDGSTEDAFIAAEWSRVYNEVDEAYTPGKGFSIRTQPATASVDTVLFRLPKDDTQYLYYTYNGDFTGNQTSITRTDNGRLAFENQIQDITVSLSNQSGDNNIFLVGNPFIATLDMEEFFNVNTEFESRYWILTGNSLSGVEINSDGTITTTGEVDMDTHIVPMQAFFVERTDGSNTTTITFTPEMTVAPTGNILRAPKRSSESNITSTSDKKLRLTASRNGLQSNVLIMFSKNADNEFNPKEDMRAIMDSNLSDFPTLYTMAGNQAAMINRLNEPDSIAIGVYSNSEEEVLLEISGVEELDTELYLYDKATNQLISLESSDTTISIEGNTHGRYYLTFTNTDNEIGTMNNSLTIHSVGNGKVRITTDSEDLLQEIRVYHTDGSLVKEFTSINDTSITVNLSASQIYIINISTYRQNIHQKIYCR